ncbi:MAG: PorV/PorQ family protein [Candidatus Krumholzibacteriota bacterium]|nr:PorV/PorQ family protein [Candidatus Krumholzibacteriota bacterium]
MHALGKYKPLFPLAGLGLAALLLLAAAPPARSAEQTSGAPGDWLSRYQSARTLGLGGAFVATADDPLGAAWNPAGLTLLYRNRFHGETARLFDETSINGVAFGVPSGRLPGFGLTVLSLGSGGFERTDDMNNPLGEFGMRETAFLLSTAMNLGRRLSLGASLKVVTQDVEDYSANGLGCDLGLLYDVTPTLRLGASALNLGGPALTLRETEESYPVELRGGASLAVLDGRGLVSLELDHRAGRGASLHGGAEFWVLPAFALRAGYDDSNPVGGFSYRLAHNMRFDYGVASHDLGLTHRVGIGISFGGYAAASVASPPVFSPTGRNSITKIQLEARTKAEARDWSLAIVNKSGEVVRRFGGKGLPPAHVPWDGKDDHGLRLQDGVYRFRLVVTDSEGRTIVGPERSVEILTAGPQGSVPIVVD